MMMAAASGVDTAALADILPRIEAAIINPADDGTYDGDDADGDA